MPLQQKKLRICIFSAVIFFLAVSLGVCLWPGGDLALFHFENGKTSGTSSSEEYYQLVAQMEDGYLVAAGQVKYAGVPIPSAESETFSSLGGGYARDIARIYYKGREVAGADPGSFTVRLSDESGVLLDFIAEDKNTIFVEDKAFSIPKKDIFLSFHSFPSLQFLSGQRYDALWSIFEDEVYFYSIDTYSGSFSRIARLPGVRPENFRQLLDDTAGETLYATDGTDVYYTDLKVTGADIPTFTISGYFAKDKHSVYFGAERLPRADPETFAVWGEGYGYSHDARRVYYESRLIDGADWHSFHIDTSTGYSWDAHHVYYRGSRIPAADPRSFSVVGRVCSYGDHAVFGKDRDTVFRDGDRLELLDVKTFQIVDDLHVRDARTILRCGRDPVTEEALTAERITPSDPLPAGKTRVDVGNNYERDEQGRYHYRDYRKNTEGAYVLVDVAMPEVDTETFSPFGQVTGFATDRDFIYWKGQVVGGYPSPRGALPAL